MQHYVNVLQQNMHVGTLFIYICVCVCDATREFLLLLAENKITDHDYTAPRIVVYLTKSQTEKNRFVPNRSC